MAYGKHVIPITDMGSNDYFLYKQQLYQLREDNEEGLRAYNMEGRYTLKFTRHTLVCPITEISFTYKYG